MFDEVVEYDIVQVTFITKVRGMTTASRFRIHVCIYLFISKTLFVISLVISELICILGSVQLSNFE